MIKVIKKENKKGMINIIANDLYRFEDIQEACIKLGYDNHKMLDELTGFPNGKDKCVGVLANDYDWRIDYDWQDKKDYPIKSKGSKT